MRGDRQVVCCLIWIILTGIGAAGLGEDLSDTGNLYLVQVYEEDFSSERVRDDSHHHSLFWPSGAMEPNEPTLSFVDFSSTNNRLLFRAFEKEHAMLGYRIPVIPDTILPPVPIIVEVLLDVQFLTSADFSQPVVGHLAYRTSADGQNWGGYHMLEPGRNHLNLGLVSEHRFIRFLGHQAVIDNVVFRLYREKGTWRIPDHFPTIQDAVDAATEGDSIVLAPKIYDGVGNYNINFKGKNLVILGEGGRENCVIDCQSKGQGFQFTQGESQASAISGLSIINGYGRQGGGVFIDGSSPRIVDCIIQDCASESNTVDDAQGAGIYCRGGQPVIRDCWILRNQAYANNAGSQGGGIYVKDSGARIEGCIISENVADSGLQPVYGGGGVYISGSTGASVGTPMVRHCLVVGNVAAGYGGGLHARETSIEIINCTVVGNTSRQTHGGGGLYLHDARQEDSLAQINSSIVWGNETTSQGEQIALGSAAQGGEDPLVLYSQIQGGWPGPGNDTRDPCFVDPSQGDYHLKAQSGYWSAVEKRWVLGALNSPCLDSGDPELDYSSEYQFSGERVNRGVYGGTAQASKGLDRLVYHVDFLGNDNNAGLTRETALASIQTAVNRTQYGDMVLVWPGVYQEDVDLNGKGILIQSAADAAVVIGQNYAFSFFSAEGPDTIVRNFVIRDCQRAGVLCDLAIPTLSNLTIVNCAWGITAIDIVDFEVSNCILWDNRDGDLSRCRARYSCIEHINQGQGEGPGNISRNPRFVDPNNRDYHLQSRFGRYWPQQDVWVVDKYQSPCIDGGDPSEFPFQEPESNGLRMNMGAYGGTRYASRSAPMANPDLNLDGIVDFLDFAIMAERWLLQPL